MIYSAYSPCYIDQTADISISTRRVLWGKLINSGQTCIAPDYILCSKEVQAKFLKEAKLVLDEWYGSNHKDSPDLCRIVNQNNYQCVFYQFSILSHIVYMYLFFY